MSDTYISRGMLEAMASAVGKLNSSFKGRLSTLCAKAAISGGSISTAELLSMQYDSNFMMMLTEVSTSLVSTLKSSAQAIAQKM